MPDRRRRHDQKVNIRLPDFPYYKLDFVIDPKDQKDWDRLGDFVHQKIPEIMQEAFHNATKKYAKKIQDIVKQSLQTGKPPRGTRWDPHSPHTIKRYGEHPLLNLTGTYERAVSIYQDKSGRVLVGIPPRHNSSSGRLTLNALAIILEYGSGRGGSRQGTTIPPRPLWAPAFKKAGGEKGIKDLVYGDMESRVRRALRDNYTYRSMRHKPKLKLIRGK